jgi:hypothetical protein
MRTRAVQWLYSELPRLAELGIIDSATADRLRNHYGEVEPNRPGRTALLAFGILGTILIGAGVILVLAHNWDDLSRPVRAVLSFLPLAMSQCIALWVINRRPESLPWRESSSSMVFLMIGASISLVAQTYNISGDFSLFILTWALLGLPLAYVLDALIPALLYLSSITAWACNTMAEDGFAAGYWLLLAMLVPFAISLVRKDRFHPRLTTLLWAACISVTVAAGVTIERVWPGLWIIVYASIFALIFLCGEFWFAKAEGFWTRPLRHFGAGGILVLSFLLTFEWPWREIGWHCHRWDRIADTPWRALPDLILGGIVPLAAITLLVTTWRRKQPLGLVLGLAPIIAVCGFGVAASFGEYAGSAAIFDLYLFAIGLWLLVTGIRIPLQGQMNLGLFVISSLIVARFFDCDLDFLLRGLLFIALGIAFLVTNIILIRRKGSASE